MRSLTLISALALVVTLGSLAAADEDSARLRARVRMLQGRIDSLEGIVEDQAAEMEEMRHHLERVIRHLERRGHHEEDEERAERKREKKKAKKKGKKKKGKKKKGKKKKGKKKGKKKKGKKKKARKVEGEPRDVSSPRVPQVSVATVERLEEVAQRLKDTARKISAIRKTGNADQFEQSRQVGRKYLSACLNDAEKATKTHTRQLKHHALELGQRFAMQTKELEGRLGEIEQAHGQLSKQAKDLAAREGEAKVKARFVELRALGEKTERKLHAIHREREQFQRQVEQGLQAVEKAFKATHQAAGELERAIQK